MTGQRPPGRWQRETSSDDRRAEDVQVSCGVALASYEASELQERRAMGRVCDRRLAFQPCFQTLPERCLGHLLHGLWAALLRPPVVRLQSRIFLEKMRQKAAESIYIIVEYGFCSLSTCHA